MINIVVCAWSYVMTQWKNPKAQRRVRGFGSAKPIVSDADPRLGNPATERGAEERSDSPSSPIARTRPRRIDSAAPAAADPARPAPAPRRRSAPAAPATAAARHRPDAKISSENARKLPDGSILHGQMMSPGAPVYCVIRNSGTDDECTEEDLFTMKDAADAWARCRNEDWGDDEPFDISRIGGHWREEAGLEREAEDDGDGKSGDGSGDGTPPPGAPPPPKPERKKRHNIGQKAGPKTKRPAEPTQADREARAAAAHVVIGERLNGKRTIVIDDAYAALPNTEWQEVLTTDLADWFAEDRWEIAKALPPPDPPASAPPSEKVAPDPPTKETVK
jgi:hypothetical protein